jgi:hypothetical protein
MPKIQIEKDDLVTAMTGSVENMYWFLDKETGEIFNLFEPSYYDSEEMENPDAELWDKVEANEGDRYETVIICESREAYQIMENFVDSLTDLKAVKDLYKALSQRRPFANFKGALNMYPDLREKWFRFHEDALTDQAEDWLDGLGIEYEIVDKRKL